MWIGIGVGVVAVGGLAWWLSRRRSSSAPEMLTAAPVAQRLTEAQQAQLSTAARAIMASRPMTFRFG
jgi:hypothetical protein